MALYTEKDLEGVCAGLIRRHFDLCEKARLNLTSGCAILGVSRSRYNQWRKKPNAVCQAHIFLNLIESNARIEQGLEEGWLPASAARGEPQETAVQRIASDA